MSSAARHALPLLLILAVLATGVRAGEPIPPPASDPILEVEALLLRYARARVDASPDADEALAAARARAEGDERLPAYVARWAALEAEGLARCVRLQDAWADAKASGDRQAARAVIASVTSVAHDLETGVDTVAVVDLHAEAAEAYVDLQRGADVLRHGRAAAEAAERLTWWARAVTLWHWTSRYAARRGEYRTALETVTRAVDASAKIGGDVPRPVLRHDLAIATYRTGGLAEAIPIAEAARREAFAAGDRHTAARVLNTLVNIHMAKGDANRAIEFALKSIEEAEALGDRDGWLKTKTNLAAVYVRAGRYADAIGICEEILASPEAQKSKQLYAVTSGNLAGTLFRLGKIEEAIVHLERALDAAREAGLDSLVKGMEAGLATMLAQTEQVQQSPAVLERVIAYYERTGNREGAARALLSLANAYQRLGESEKAAAHQARALEAFEVLGDRLAAARVHHNLGRNHEDHERWPEALRAFEETLRVHRALGLRVDDTGLALLGCARIHIRRGAPDRALPFLDQARGVFVDLLDGLGDEDALELAARVRRVSDWGVNAAEDMVQKDATRQAEAAEIAYRHLESTRAILLSEALANAETLLEAALPPQIRGEDERTRAGVVAARRRVVDLATSGAEAHALHEAKAALDDAWAKRKACVARVQRSARRAAQIAYPRVAPLGDVQRALDADTALIQYRFLKVLMAVVVTKEGAAIVRLGDSAAIREDVRAYLRVASTPGMPESKPAARLHAALLAPLADRIGKAKRLVISPDGELAYLPFGALLDEATGTRLIERCAISMIPSATVLETLRREAPAEAGAHVLCVGDPIYPSEKKENGLTLFRRLRKSGAEATEVASFFPEARRTVLLREHATVKEFVDAATDPERHYRAIHLACHAHTDADRPRRSSLALTDAEMLDVDAILGLRIRADLVVLSACETARGKLAQGEGVMGFVRALFHAGVPRAIVSSWPISDASTQPFMRAFYEGLVQRDLSPADALRRAQVRCLENGGDRAHPYHWAAFTLWGLDP